MNWTEIKPKADLIKNGLHNIVGRLLDESKYENVPKPDSSLESVKNILENPEYNIVVCGEVKNGKSTFINAVIGKDILPTGVKETTSQVFRISNSDNESFQLVFKDGSVETISGDQLTLFGSQVDAELLGEPLFKGRRLDYIQIYTPVEFLPKGVNIVDTPGLGALYKSHSEITNDYIKRADAVIFILTANQPLVQQEKEFLKKVFEVTPFVMFVMTKIDTVDTDAWVNQIRRNETLLKGAFENCCYNIPKVFPISSTVLCSAAKEEEKKVQELLLEDSFYLQVREELLAVMFKAVGLSRSNFALAKSAQYFNSTFPGIEEQLRMIASESEKEQSDIKKKKETILNDFNANWGPTSTKRKEIILEISLLLNAARTECYQLFDTNGSLYQKFLIEINSLGNADDAKKYSETMGNNIVTEINCKWQKITGAAQREIALKFNTYKAQISMHQENNLSLTKTDTSVSISESHLGDSVQGMLKVALPSMGAYTAGTYILSIVGMSIPITLPIVLLGAAIWGAFKGKTTARERELQKIKGELTNYLNKIFNDVRHQMTEVSVVHNKYRSAVDEFTSELLSAAESAIADIFEKSKKQFISEKERLEKHSKLKGEERKKELDFLNQQRKRWIVIGEDLKKLSSSFQELKQSLL